MEEGLWEKTEDSVLDIIIFDYIDAIHIVNLSYIPADGLEFS